jgi:hypothetical protein
MNSASRLVRSAGATLFALMLALRLVGATGYMPGFDRGSLTIIVCPDADPEAPLAVATAHLHHGKTKHSHGTCPYAAASAIGAIGPESIPLLAMLFLGAALLAGRPLRFLERHRSHDRPPPRGPPFPA